MDKIISKENNIVRFIVLVSIVAAAAVYRLLPHPANLAPVGAIALFGGAYFGSRVAAFFVPLLSLWISDLVLNNFIYQEYFPSFTLFYEGFAWQYGAFAGVTFIGFLIKNKVNAVNVISASVAGSVLFFVISNFGVWIGSTMYSHTFSGLMACYTMAIPFFQNTLFGDAIFSIVAFGAFELLKSRYTLLKLKEA